MMSGTSKHFRFQSIPVGLNVTGVLTVSRLEEDQPFRERYLTARVDITARTKDVGKIFESFHFIAVPDEHFDSYSRMRRELTRSLKSCLRRLAQALDTQGATAGTLSH